MSLFSTDRVLVPIDFSEESFAVQQQALELVGDASKLYILHVLPHLEATEPGVVWNTLDDTTRKENVKNAFFERFTDPSYSGVHFEAIVGEASHSIAEYAQKKDIQLIVMPFHRRTNLWYFLTGSVAERVVRMAPCPVLVLQR